MRNILYMLFFSIFITRVQAQEHKNYSLNKLSLESKVFSNTINKVNYKKSNNNIEELIEKNYPIKEIDKVFYVGAIIEVKKGTSKSSLESLNIKVNSVIGEIISCLIPLECYNEVIEMEEILRIEITKIAGNELDEVKNATKVNWVQSGIGLSKAYCGKDVVVGIIDRGFDFTHPIFYDTSNINYRIKRVWCQSDNGNHPGGFNYGTELIDKNDIINKAYDISNSSHGTLVAGIAVGGSSFSNEYKGVAPESDIVLVAYDGSWNGVLDGAQYIFDYAESVNKPAVINMSFGTIFSINDGTSLIDIALDDLMEEGKIIVTSAGNDGDEKVHLCDTLLAGNSFSTIIRSYENTNTGNFTVYITGSVNTEFSVQAGIVNSNNQLIEDSTSKVSTEMGTSIGFYIIDSDLDSTFVTFTPSHYNSAPMMSIEIENTNQEDDFQWVYVKVESQQTNIINAWGYDCQFTDLSLPLQYLDGDSDYSIGVPGNGNRIITVGSYTTKTSFVNYDGTSLGAVGTLNDISGFSSKGPTYDGRVKPDICAPGNIIVSAVSSFDSFFLPLGSEWEKVTNSVINGTDEWYFGAVRGTSMSCPVVAGIVALWLENDSTLTPEDVKQYFQNYSIMDNYTGVIPNNTWGYGKIDAYEMLKSIIPADIERGSNDFYNIYPNPSKGQFSIETYIESEIQIFDVTGKQVFNDYILEGKSYLDLSHLSNGIYLASFKNDNYTNQTKIVINK